MPELKHNILDDTAHARCQITGSERRLIGIIGSATDAIIAIDDQQRIMLFNTAAERLLRCQAADAIGQPLDRYIPEQLSEASRNDTLGMAAAGADRPEFPMELAISEIMVGSERVFTAVVRDISERKRAEESQAKLAAIVESSDDAIISKTLDDIIVTWNGGAERIFGYTAAEIIGQPISLLIPPDRLHEEKEIQECLARGERLEHFETVRIAKDGRKTEVSLTVSPVRNAAGTIVGASKIVRDITARKESERCLALKTEELAASNQDLEQFAYVASHDLQEPLRAVAGCVQLLQQRYKDKIDARADELIQHAVEGATRMQTLLTDLLMYSRVGTRGTPPQPADCNIILQRAMANLEVAIRESGAQVINDGLPTLPVDVTQMTQVFQNLLANAIKFQGQQKPEIQISAVQGDGRWTFRVRDNGIGIEPQYFERIFGVFQRLHTRKEYPGTGIGLAICKKTIERHGGKLWIESKLGCGSTFCFTIPQES